MLATSLGARLSANQIKSTFDKVLHAIFCYSEYAMSFLKSGKFEEFGLLRRNGIVVGELIWKSSGQRKVIYMRQRQPTATHRDTDLVRHRTLTTHWCIFKVST